LTNEEILQFSEKVLKLLQDSDKRKQENIKDLGDEALEDEDKEYLHDDNDTEEELHVAIAQLIGILFKTHKAAMMPMVDILYL
jgi:hypothetical protein